VSDFLYTSNFAILGLHEAAAATGNESYIRAENALADYLVRLQARSVTHPEVDGAFMRPHFDRPLNLTPDTDPDLEPEPDSMCEGVRL